MVAVPSASGQLGLWVVFFATGDDVLKADSNVPGIYALWQKDLIVYIGMATISVRSRVVAHGLQQNKVFDRATFIPMESKEEIRDSEAHAIRSLKPLYNVDIPPKTVKKRKEPVYHERYCQCCERQIQNASWGDYMCWDCRLIWDIVGSLGICDEKGVVNEETLQKKLQVYCRAQEVMERRRM